VKIFLSTFLFVTSFSFAQFQNILIGTQNEPEEVSICINPKNPNQIVAGANIDNCYYSSDGGLTWTHQILTSPDYGVWGDPCIFADTNGAFYFAHLSYPPNGNWIDRIVVQKSNDGGVSWSDGSYTGLDNSKAQDKEWAVVNPFNNEIYMSWTQFDQYGSTQSNDSSIIRFSKSADSGLTWSEPKRINKKAGDCIDSDNTLEGAVPAVGPNGEIYIAWAGPDGLVFNKSLDGGETWLSQEIFVSDMPGGWDYNISGLQRCNGLPVTSCDISNGNNRGAVYINWTDQRNGSDNTDVWLVKSTDGGDTWSSPIQVNNDISDKQQFFTWMCIDQLTGCLYFVFYDRRNYSEGDSTDVYLARSIDGGNTFSNYKINENLVLPKSGIFFGDYINITAYNGMIRPIWMSYAASTLSAWTAIIDDVTLNLESPANHCCLPVELNQNFPNPFNESTHLSFELLEKEKVSLYLCNALGEKIKILFENLYYNKGEHDYILNAKQLHLPAGIYYYVLESDEYRLAKRMSLY
jgi:hypothetical protein